MFRSDARARAERTRRAWERFWFAPGRAIDLGICRFAFIALTLYSVPFSGFGAWSDLPSAMWEPGLALRRLGLVPSSAAALEAMGTALKACLVTAALGLLARPSCAVAALLSFYLLGLRESFGGVYHGTTVIPLVLLILAVARCGDAWSLDSLLRRAAGRARAPRAVPPGEYTWPIRLVQCLFVLVFCAAGIAKLRQAGLAWAASDNLSEILVAQHYNLFAPPSDLGLRLAELRYVCMAAAAAVLAAETLAPLALFSVAARNVLLPILMVFLLSLPTLFGFSFETLLALFVFWVPWHRLGVGLGLFPLHGRRRLR